MVFWLLLSGRLVGPFNSGTSSFPFPHSFLLPLPPSPCTPNAHALPAGALHLRSLLTLLSSLAPFPFFLSLLHSIHMDPPPHAPPSVVLFLQPACTSELIPLLKESGSNPSAGRFRPYASTKHRVTRGRYITSNDRRGYIPVYEYPLNGAGFSSTADAPS